MLTEITWSRLRGPQKLVHAAREKWRMGGMGCAAFDPGKHGALAVQSPSNACVLHPLGDERRGGLAVGAKICLDARVRVLVVEAQYAPRAYPWSTPHSIAAQAAGAMHAARDAGLFTGLLAGAIGNGLVVIYVAPATWQTFVLSDGKPKVFGDNSRPSEELKELSLKLAKQRVPAQIKSIPRAPDRIGAADAHGILTWFLTSPMGERS